MSDEQWKSGGRCNECRRNNYCKTECTQHKRRVEYDTKCFIRDKLDEKSHGMFSMILNASSFKDYF